MRKKFIALFVSMILIIVSLPTIASANLSPTDASSVVAVECIIADLKGILAPIIEDRPLIASSRTDVDFSVYENLHLHPHYDEYMLDRRLALLREFADYVADARTIQIDNGTVIRESIDTFPFVITSFGGISYSCDVFVINFSDEKYFVLLDMILEFTGLEIEMVEVGVGGPMTFLIPDYLPIFVEEEIVAYEHEMDEDEMGIMPFALTIRMGTAIYKTHPLGARVRFGSMGHPSDLNGFGGFITHHSMLARGDRIYARGANGGVTHIGTVSNAVFNMDLGVDLSHINMVQGVFVQNPGFTNLFASNPPSRLNVITERGSVAGNLISTSRDVEVIHPVAGVRITMRRMIVTDHWLITNDSGSALTSGNSVFGTAVGTSSNPRESFFSAAPNYSGVR